MCGFAGTTSSDLSVLLKLKKSIQERAYDAESTYSDTHFSLYHAHLKISDLDKDTSQPFLKDSYVISFTGEIYNRSKLKSILDKHNEISELEIVYHLYKKFGENFIEKVNGEFGIAIFDKSENKLLLYRDRQGTKPIYYTINTDGEILFSSKISSFVTQESKLSNENIYSHMVYGFGISPLTFINKVYRVPAGNMLVFKNKSLTIQQYNSFITQTSYNFMSELENTVKRRIPQYQDSIFLSLSGGLDSTIIAYFLKKYFRGDIIAYTFSSKNNQEDVQIAKSNASILGIKHHILESDNSIENPLSHEGLTSLPDLYKSLREKLPEYKHIKVEFGGDGKEELFQTNTNFDMTRIHKYQDIFVKKGLIKKKEITYEFLNSQMLEYNLEMIDKMSLKYGIERRLPFLDYELIKFEKYSNYNTDIRTVLKENGLSFTHKKYGYSDGIDFTYLETKKVILQSAKSLIKNMKQHTN